MVTNQKTSLSAGTGYTLRHSTTCGTTPQTTSTYTITDDDSRVTLRKQWVNAKVGDDANVTVARGLTVIDTLESDAGTSGELDTDATPTLAIIGETWTLSETLVAGNGGTYSGAVACTGAADTVQTNGLTIATGETNIVCTYNNTRTTTLTVAKTSTLISDGISVSNPKVIPGATLRYCILISNTGTAAARNVIASDNLRGTTSFLPGTMRSGTSCAGAATVEDDNNGGTDETDPNGASITRTSITAIAPTIAAGGSFALTFDIKIQ